MGLKAGQKYSIISWADHTVIDAKGGKLDNGTEVINYEWKQGWNQKFEAIPKDDIGYFLLKAGQDGNSDRVLDHYVNAGKLIIYDKNGGLNQQWSIEPIRPGAFVCYIKSRQNGYVLQRDGQVSLAPKDPSNKKQLWVFAEAT